ncbi:MAG TPA: hypothetical protein VN408_31670 [Actinoplanes sp.]|nr:hypothetical protein [Actinoplanes sp.]
MASRVEMHRSSHESPAQPGRLQRVGFQVQEPRTARRGQVSIRDRDGKYAALFDVILADAGIEVVLTGVRIPRVNSIMERWIRSCRHELLDPA